MTSHALYTCKNEEALKRLLIADGVDPSLSGKVIEKYNLKMEKTEVTVEGDMYIGGNHEHHHHYKYNSKKTVQDCTQKEPKCQKSKVAESQEDYEQEESYKQLASNSQESASSKVFWWVISAVGFAGLAVVALPVAGATLGVYVAYKFITSEPKQIAYHATEEVQQEQHAQLETAKAKKHVSQWDKDQLAYKKHQLEMKQMQKEMDNIDKERLAWREVVANSSSKDAGPKKLNPSYIDTEVIYHASKLNTK